MAGVNLEETRVRLDKWLWAARFFKTRALATEAISGGKVHLNGARIKPARPVNPGDRVRIRKGEIEWDVDVVGLSVKRGPAKEAVTLYRETEESVANRERSAEERRLLRTSPQPDRRPDKRGRRQIRSFTGR
ncbi:MAG: RNA-binding protein [Gammaproteobacteria bacterium]|nr:RNA-binding protein [Gammaproteobacteria bacterium]MCP5136493.1 RNA-binding protein [Gammaproteobacteria bacterium]